MCKTLQCCQLLLLNDLILDRRETNLTTKTSVCLQISESRAKNDLLLGEMNMYLSDYNIANNKGVSRTNFVSTLILRYSLPGLSTTRKMKKLWQLIFENKGIISRKKITWFTYYSLKIHTWKFQTFSNDYKYRLFVRYGIFKRRSLLFGIYYMLTDLHEAITPSNPYAINKMGITTSHAN